MYTCSSCQKHGCKENDPAKMPKNCPCLSEDVSQIKKIYFEPENAQIAHNAALIEAAGYGNKTRLEETIAFAQKSNYKKIGIAFCLGLAKEAKTLTKILHHHGFAVSSLICKNGSISKEVINIKPQNFVHKECSYEAMCNPIGQALLFNKARTDFNIILGLCVGHDSLFIKYAKAPTTVLVAKDRVLGHNPVQALYLSESYYKNKLYHDK